MHRVSERGALKGKRGQTMLEFLIVVGSLMACTAILAIFLYTFKEYGDRVFNLISADYP